MLEVNAVRFYIFLKMGQLIPSWNSEIHLAELRNTLQAANLKMLGKRENRRLSFHILIFKIHVES